MGFNIGFITWVMSCISSVSFALLINGASSPFFHSERGLRKRCPLSLLLFLLVVEGLSCFLGDVKRTTDFKGIPISKILFISNLFVDDILIFCDGSRRDVEKLSQDLTLFKIVNESNSTISYSI